MKARAPFPPLGDALEFMRLLWALDHGLQRVSKRMELSVGVTSPQRLTMRLIGRFPGILPSQLAELLHLHPSTLSGILKRLEQQGFVTRRSDPHDHRRSQLGLTAKGRRTLTADREDTVEHAIQVALSQLPTAKIENAAEVLRELSRAIDRATQQPRASLPGEVPTG